MENSSYDNLLADNKALRKENEALRKENEALRKENAELKSLVKKLIQKVEQLEAKIGKNSSNSSKPPSSDQKPNSKPKKKKEKRPYHKGANRELLPENLVTSRETRVVQQCPHCEGDMIPIETFQSWQQIEMPKIKLLVHQIDLMKCECRNCKKTANAQMQEHEKFLLQPRMESFIQLCLGQFKMSHRSVREFLCTLIPELKLSQGLISKIKRRGQAILKGSAEAIQQEILDSSSAIHVDATGWRHEGKNQNALVLRSGNLIFFDVLEKQNQEVISSWIGSKKIHHLVSDRGFATGKLKVHMHQYCLAHLQRNIQGLAERPGTTAKEAGVLGEIYDVVQGLFHDKHRLEKGEISESTWKIYGYQDKAFLRSLLEGVKEGNFGDRVKRFCKRLSKDLNNFTVYLRYREGPMTNNPAEEALRFLVIARKLCFGSQSLYGRNWRAWFHSCLETVRRSGKSMLNFLSDLTRSSRLKLNQSNILEFLRS